MTSLFIFSCHISSQILLQDKHTSKRRDIMMYTWWRYGNAYANWAYPEKVCMSTISNWASFKVDLKTKMYTCFGDLINFDTRLDTFFFSWKWIWINLTLVLSRPTLQHRFILNETSCRRVDFSFQFFHGIYLRQVNQCWIKLFYT